MAQIYSLEYSCIGYIFVQKTLLIVLIRYNTVELFNFNPISVAISNDIEIRLKQKKKYRFLYRKTVMSGKKLEKNVREKVFW